MLPYGPFIKTFLIHTPTTYLQPVCIAKESMQNVSRSGEKGGPACGWWIVDSAMYE